MIDSPPNLVLVGIKRLDSFRWKFRICFIENYRGGGKVTQGSRIEIELHRNLRLLCGRVVITIEIIPLAIGICSPLSKFSGFSWRGGRGVSVAGFGWYFGLGLVVRAFGHARCAVTHK